jgi:phospholipid-binding lipoprotein MlaA
MIHRRAEFLAVDDVIESAAAVDEYSFIRNAYLQRRASVANGEVDEHTLQDVGQDAGATTNSTTGGGGNITEEPPE